MTTYDNFTLDPTLDLLLERTVDVPADLVWEAWTTPESLKEWFCPRPWSINDCRIELRPGGEFFFEMQSPDGKLFPNTGCILELVPDRKLVWTSCMKPGFRPMEEPENGAGLFFTGVVLMEPDTRDAEITHYKAIAIHRDEKGCRQHEAMGFHDGWGTVADQMVEHIKRQRQRG